MSKDLEGMTNMQKAVAIYNMAREFESLTRRFTQMVDAVMGETSNPQKDEKSVAEMRAVERMLYVLLGLTFKEVEKAAQGAQEEELYEVIEEAANGQK